MPEKSRKPANKAIPRLPLLLALSLCVAPLALAQEDGNTTRLPDLVVRIAPEYPDRARVRGVEGFVVVAYDIGENGSVLDPRVVESSPANVFDRAALEAVMKWKYNPRMVGGSAVSVAGVQSKITFALRE